MSASIALRLAGSLGVYRLVPWLTFTVMIGRAKSAPSVREEIAFGSRLCGASSGDSRGRAAASRAAGAMAAGRRLKVDANMRLMLFNTTRRESIGRDQTTRVYLVLS